MHKNILITQGGDMDKKEGQDSWARAAVFVRLTKRRREKLLAIAKDMPASATPSDAIERAIDLASIGEQSTMDLIVDQLVCLQESVDELASERARDAEAAATAIANASGNSKAVLDLLSAAAARTEADGWDE
jgi:hypothetical protein